MNIRERMARARCLSKGFKPDDQIKLSIDGSGEVRTQRRWEWMAQLMAPEFAAMVEPSPEMLQAARSVLYEVDGIANALNDEGMDKLMREAFAAMMAAGG